MASRGQRASLRSGRDNKKKEDKSEILKIASWNVRIIQGSEDNEDRPRGGGVKNIGAERAAKRFPIEITAMSDEITFAYFLQVLPKCLKIVWFKKVWSITGYFLTGGQVFS